MATVNLSTECPDCGAARSTVRSASLDPLGHRIRLRRCADCEAMYTTLEVVISFSFSGADSLKRERHNNRGPARRSLDSFIVKRSRAENAWIIEHHAGSWTERCGKGLHEMAGDNVYVNPTTGHRVCQSCRRETAKKRYANRIAKMPASLRAELREERRLESARRIDYRREWARRRRAA